MASKYQTRKLLTIIIIFQLLLSFISPGLARAAEVSSTPPLVLRSAGGAQPASAAPQADTTLSVSILTSPWATLDSNDPGGNNPQVFAVEGRVTNTGSSIATNVVITLDYNEDQGDNWVLLDGEEVDRIFPSLAPGESRYAYWLVRYSTTIGNAHMYSISAYADNAPLVTTSDNAYGNPLPGMTVQTRSTLSTGNSAVDAAYVIQIGVAFTMTVTYDLGSSPLTSAFSPIGNPDFDATAYYLSSATVRFYNDAGTWESFAYEQLYFPALNSLANNADVTFVFTARAPLNTHLCPFNAVTFNSSVKFDQFYCNPYRGTQIPIDGTAKLVMDKQVSSTTIQQGQVLTYTINYTNVGSLPLTYSWIWDDIDTSLASIITTTISPSPDLTQTTNSRVAWYLGTISPTGQPGSSGTLTFSVLVDGNGLDIADGTLLENTANFGINQNVFPEFIAITDTVTTTILAPTITISKTDGQSIAEPGDPLTYQLQVTNNGSVAAHGLVITDILPADVTVSGVITPTPDTQNGQTLVWTGLGPLAPGGSLTIAIPVTVNMHVPNGTTLTNQMLTRYTNPAGHAYDILETSDTTNINAPVLAISKTDSPDPVLTGNPLIYTLSYANNGPADATNVVITDVVPLSTTYDTCSGASCSMSGGIVTWNLGTVAAYSSGAVQFTVIVDGFIPDGTILYNDQYGILSDQTYFLAGAPVQTTVSLKAGNLTGYTFLDTNGNGFFDVGESWLTSVPVTLTQDTVTNTLTDAYGYYAFRVEVPGPVEVSAALPAGYFRTTPGDVILENLLGITQTVNFGYASITETFGVIYGVVYQDNNADGTQDMGDYGISGVTITSAGASISPVTTNILGQYTLLYDTPGANIINETNPPLYVSTTPDSVLVGVALGSSGPSPVNFGDFLGIMITGQVFDDVNVNGNKDLGEVGIAGAQVSAGGHTFTTGGSGDYTLFVALTAADPLDILETDPAGYVSTNAIPGAGMVKVDSNTLRISSPLSGTVYSNGDFGDVLANQVVTITGKVWNDNGAGGGGLANGLPDGTEPGLAGALVRLSTGLSQTTTTDGLFLLYAPADQAITIFETDPANYVSTNAIPGPYATKVDNNTLTVDPLSAGTTAADNLFGDVLASSVAIIQGTLFDDLNENGLLDVGEPGVPYNLVTLQIQGGNTITVLTDANGGYQFAVAPLTNIAITADRPVGYYPTTPETLFLYPPTPGVYPDNNFGFSNDADTAVIYGIVFNDLNSNGIQEFGELGLPDAILTLDGTSSQTTAASGLVVGTFAFTVTQAGVHNLVETNPPGYRSTTPDTLNIPVTLGNSYFTTYGDVNSANTAAIYGTVFDDFNANGLQEPDEPGLAGVVISVTVSAPGGVVTTTTAAYGQFSFNLGIGEQGYHTVSEQDPALPGYRSTTPDHVNLYIVPGNSYNINFGDTQNGLSSIMGIVFNDLNSDGNQDLAELGIPGVLISLSNGVTTTTNQYGNYSFAVADPGYYEVIETDLPGYHSTTPNVVPVMVQSEQRYQVDFGDNQSAFATSIFGTVFNDLDVNGLRDPGEPGLAGVLVSLTGVLSATQYTNQWGQYTFLVEYTGIYTITETDNTGWVSTNAIPGSPAVTKVDNNTLRTEIVALGIDVGDNLFADAYAAAVITIDGQVWDDNGTGAGGVGGDGLPNGSEPGLAGALVSLSSGMSQLTALDGTFILYAPPGQVITITQTNLAGYISTGAIAGTNASVLDYDHIAVIDALGGGDSSLGNLFGDVLIATGLELTKEAEDINGPPLLVDDTIRYTLQVTNTGSTPAFNVTVTDQLPNGITFVEMLPTAGTVSGPNPIIWSLPVLAPATSETLWITATIDLDQSGQTITNTGSLTSSNVITPPIDPPEVCPDGSLPVDGQCPTTPQDQSDLLITKTASTDQVSAGDPLTYTIVITNLGPSTANQVVVTDTLPADVTFDAYSATQGTFDDLTDLWTVGSLGAGTSATLTLFVTVNPDASGTLVNTAQAASEDYDPDLGNNTATVQTGLDALSDLSITKSDDPDPVAAGGILTYTLFFNNAGPSDAQGLVITDELPLDVTFLGIVSQPGYLSGPVQTGQSLVWTGTTLTAGTSGTIIFTVQVHPQASGTLQNHALLSSATAEANPADNQAFESTTVGAFGLATIFGWVYDDLNGNGLKDVGEAGLPGVVVTLDGSFTAITDADGLYYFITDITGLHSVVETDPSGYFSTTPNEVHVNVILGNSYQVDFGDAQFISSFATIYGTVFEDLDGDGIWDLDEPGIPGVTVTLDGSTTAETDQYGSYSLLVNEAGVHTVVETDLVGYLSTTPNEVHVLVVLGNGYQVDFGDALDTSAFAVIYGTVFEDLDGDGIWDAGEVGLPNVTLTLDGVTTTTTDQFGTYTFNVAETGVHTLIETDPPGYLSTTPNEVHLLVEMGNGYQIDFGDAPVSSTFATIFGTVFEDTDGDGLWDAGEVGLSNVTLTLDGVTTTTTDQFGSYSFRLDQAGMHTVVETDPDGYFSTTPNEVHLLVELGNGYQVDFGDALDTSAFAVIYGTVFDDIDGDGVWDLDEVGIPGVTVTLDDLTQVTTNQFGFYTFRVDTAGVHTVAETDPVGFFSTTPNEVHVNVELSHSYQVNFGDARDTSQFATIFGTVFEDTDGDGFWDANEVGLPNVVLTLDGAVTTTTDEYGAYSFNVTQPGVHTVVETDPDGYISTTPNEIHVAVELGNGYLVDFGDALDTSDFATIYGTVFEDTNANGVWDAGEIGLTGVTLTLDGSTTATTNQYGYYTFNVVVAGLHTILETDLDGYVSTTPNEIQVDMVIGNDYQVDFGDMLLCICDPDAFEDDDSPGTATPIQIGPDGRQAHDFCDDSVDWLSFNVQAGGLYTITTSSWGQRADTFLALFDTDGHTLLAANDDFQGAPDYSSQVVWQAPSSGTYFLQVINRDGLTCCNTDYDIWVEGTVHEFTGQFLPYVVKGFQGTLGQPAQPDPPSPQGVISHMCPDDYEVDDSWELAQPILPGIPQVHSFDSNPALFAADKDVVEFAVRSGDIVTFTVTTLTDTTTLLELFDKHGNALNITGTTQIVWEVPLAGTYFLSVGPQTQNYGCVYTAGYELLMQLHQPIRSIIPVLYK